MTPKGRTYSILLLTSVALGSQFPASKIVVDSIDPFTLTASRVGIGAFIGIGAMTLRNRLEVRAIVKPKVLALGGLLGLVYVLLNVGVQYTTASKTALFVNASVVHVALFMFLFFGERMTRAKAMGLGISLLGVVVLTTHLDPAFLAGGELIGDFLVFLSGLCWAGCVVVAKWVVVHRSVDEWNLAGSALVIASVISLVPFIFVKASLPSTPIVWTAVLYLGLVPTFFPLLVCIHSMKTISPTVSNLLILPAVLVAAVLSFGFLSEPIGLSTILGGALVLGGGFVAAR
jgi:drug/metabolite transporter (DMT)-like permease